MRLVIIDDHPIFREGVALTLAAEKDIEVVGQGETVEEALFLLGQHKPDILLLDLDIPGGGLSVLPSIRSVSPNTHVVILTATSSETHLLAAMQAGAHGYVLKGVLARQLAKIVRMVSAGEHYVSPNLAAYVLSRAAGIAPPQPPSLLGSLTERELQILELVAEGATNLQIAQSLHITENTVKNNMTRIMEKLGVHNRVAAAMLVKGRKSQE